MEHSIKTVGIVGSGIMGSGIAEVAAKAGLRGRAALAQQATADAMVAGAREVARPSRSSGASSSDDDRDAILGRVTATDHLARPRRLRPRDRVGRRGPRRQEGAVRRARPDRQGRRHPRHQHLDAAGRRDGRGHAAARPGVRHPLLQPGADDEAGRDRPAAHRQRRHDRRRMAFAAACGKDAVEVDDRAGFIVNALLFPYLNNAVRMLENGTASRDDIDTAMKGGCNFPMGPLALLDLVGLDTSRRHPRRALRRVPRPELRRRADAAPHGRRRPPRPQVRRGLLRRTDRSRRGGRQRDDGADRARCRRRSSRRRRGGGFPTPELADDDGLVGVGADLEPGTLLAAYRHGPVPDAARRGAASAGGRPTRAASSRSTGCASAARCAQSCGATRSASTPRFARGDGAPAPTRAGRGGWITADIRRRLPPPAPSSGWAHSVEAWTPTASWSAGSTASRIGGLFAGESMFHRADRRLEGRARRASSSWLRDDRRRRCSTCSGRRRTCARSARSTCRGRSTSRRLADGRGASRGRTPSTATRQRPSRRTVTAAGAPRAGAHGRPRRARG